MTTRFNPPPGWPLAGLGALPRACWEPDSALPPAPPRWPFYVDDRGYATDPPPSAWQPPVTAAPPAPVAPGRHRRARRRLRWSPLLVALPVTAVSVVVVVLGVLAAVRL
jgi:hypothetical protein